MRAGEGKRKVRTCRESQTQPLLGGEGVTGRGLRVLLKLDLMKRETLEGSMAKACGKMKWEEEVA